MTDVGGTESPGLQPVQAGRRSAPGRLLQRVGQLPLREKLYGLTIFLFTGFLRWALEKGFDYVSSRGLENRAEEAQRALAARTTAVGFGVRDLQAKLDALGSGEPSAGETASIATDAQELLGG